MNSASNNRLGIGLMCLGILLFALNDVMGKWLMSTYTVGQVLLLRSAAAILILVPFALKEGLGAILRAPRPGLQLARVAFGTLETACFYWAVATLPLVSVMTFYLSAPLYVAAIAPFLLKERLARDQWLAVILGFVGVLCVLQPSGETLTLPAIIAIVGKHALRRPDALHPPAARHLGHLADRLADERRPRLRRHPRRPSPGSSRAGAISACCPCSAWWRCARMCWWHRRSAWRPRPSSRPSITRSSSGPASSAGSSSANGPRR